MKYFKSNAKYGLVRFKRLPNIYDLQKQYCVCSCGNYCSFSCGRFTEKCKLFIEIGEKIRVFWLYNQLSNDWCNLNSASVHDGLGSSRHFLVIKDAKVNKLLCVSMCCFCGHVVWVTEGFDPTLPGLYDFFLSVLLFSFFPKK